jgi:hypothetical protein
VVFLDLRVASRLRCDFLYLIARCSAFVPTIGLLGVGPSLDGGKDEALGRACRKGMGVNTVVPKAIGAIGCLPLEEASPSSSEELSGVFEIWRRSQDLFCD